VTTQQQIDAAINQVRRVLETVIETADEAGWCENSLEALDAVRDGIQMRADELREDEGD